MCRQGQGEVHLQVVVAAAAGGTCGESSECLCVPRALWPGREKEKELLCAICMRQCLGKASTGGQRGGLSRARASAVNTGAVWRAWQSHFMDDPGMRGAIPRDTV